MQIRFDRLPGGPGDEARFVEAENDKGESIRLEWVEDGDTVLLKIPDGNDALCERDEARAEVKIMTDRIADIRARFEAATPGPWGIVDSGCRDVELLGPDDARIADIDAPLDCNDTDQRDANAALIAAAPTDLAWLCDEVETLRGIFGNTRRRTLKDNQPCWCDRVPDDDNEHEPWCGWARAALRGEVEGLRSLLSKDASNAVHALDGRGCGFHIVPGKK